MLGIVDQVRDGLTAKAEGIRKALEYVRDPREIERLEGELRGAHAALVKLAEKDERTPEEVAELEQMISDVVEIEAPALSWSEMNNFEKFRYQLDLYIGKLEEALKSAQASRVEANLVCNYLRNVDFEKFPFMRGIYKQVSSSLAEIDFSIKEIESQLAVKDSELICEAEESLFVDSFFERLTALNILTNNPMNLPHLTEARDLRLKELENAKSKIDG